MNEELKLEYVKVFHCDGDWVVGTAKGERICFARFVHGQQARQKARKIERWIKQRIEEFKK